MATTGWKHFLRFDSDAAKAGQRCARTLRPGAAGAAILLMIGALCASRPVGAQQDDAPPALTPPSMHSGPGAPRGDAEHDALTHRAEERMSARRNEDRQKALVADTQKLLAMAEQLKVEVDKSSKDQLSVDVYKQAEQIEKLARSVKDKMRGY